MTRSIALCLALGGCAGSSVQPMPMPMQPPPITHETVLVSQPATIPVYNNVNPPKDAAGVTLWGPVEKLPALPSNATSAGGELAIVIDSGSIPGNMAARGGLGSIVLGYSFKVPVQARQYRYSYDLRVSRANPVSQVVAYLNLHDRTSGAHLWLGQIAFDTRCNKAGDVMWDQGTNTPIYNVVANGFSCATYGDWRSFSFTIGQTEVVNAVQALRSRFPTLQLSTNMADYELTHINVNPEIVGAGSRIDIGIKGWTLTRIDQ